MTSSQASAIKPSTTNMYDQLLDDMLAKRALIIFDYKYLLWLILPIIGWIIFIIIWLVYIVNYKKNKMAFFKSIHAFSRFCAFNNIAMNGIYHVDNISYL